MSDREGGAIAWRRDGVTYRVEGDELVVHLDGDPPDVTRRRPLTEHEAALAKRAREHPASLVLGAQEVHPSEVPLLRELVDLQDRLLGCYRMGKRPPATVLDRMSTVRRALDALRGVHP